MKKIICAIMTLMLLVSGLALAETLAPQFTELNTTEATYPVAFNRDNLKDGTLTDAHLFTEDIYDIAEVDKLAVGDTFEAEGKSITVETIEKDEFGHINLNGGFEAENGYTLTTAEDTNGWTTLLWDDFCTHTDRGAVSLELAEDVTFTDAWFLDLAAIEAGREAITATGIEAVTKAIQESENDSFYELNTEIVLKDGKVTEINRHYVP